MSLAGELAAARNYKPNRPRCTVCTYRDMLPEDDRAALLESLESDMMTRAVMEGLRVWHEKSNRGPVPFSLGTLQRHRNGECRGA